MDEWKNRYSHLETNVGAGYYAFRQNDSKTEYTKLVKADRSPILNAKIYGTPSVGRRTDRPAKRRARRNNGIS